MMVHFRRSWGCCDLSSSLSSTGPESWQPRYLCHQSAPVKHYRVESCPQFASSCWSGPSISSEPRRSASLHVLATQVQTVPAWCPSYALGVVLGSGTMQSLQQRGTHQVAVLQSFASSGTALQTASCAWCSFLLDLVRARPGSKRTIYYSGRYLQVCQDEPMH